MNNVLAHNDVFRSDDELDATMESYLSHDQKENVATTRISSGGNTKEGPFFLQPGAMQNQEGENSTMNDGMQHRQRHQQQHASHPETRARRQEVEAPTENDNHIQQHQKSQDVDQQRLRQSLQYNDDAFSRVAPSTMHNRSSKSGSVVSDLLGVVESMMQSKTPAEGLDEHMHHPCQSRATNNCASSSWPLHISYPHSQSWHAQSASLGNTGTTSQKPSNQSFVAAHTQTRQYIQQSATNQSNTPLPPCPPLDAYTATSDARARTSSSVEVQEKTSFDQDRKSSKRNRADSDISSISRSKRTRRPSPSPQHSPGSIKQRTTTSPKTKRPTVSLQVGGQNHAEPQPSEQGKPPAPVWSKEQHRIFINAIIDLGIKHSSPSTIMEHMVQAAELLKENTECNEEENATSVLPSDKRPAPKSLSGLTSERIKSKLQKYRLNKIKSAAEFMDSYDKTLAKLIQGYAIAPINGPTKLSNNPNADIVNSALLLLKSNDAIPAIPSLVDGGEFASFMTLGAMLGGDFSGGNKKRANDKSGGDCKNDSSSIETQQPCKLQVCMPKLTPEEIKSPLGAAMGYLKGLFFVLRCQLTREGGADDGSDFKGVKEMMKDWPKDAEKKIDGVSEACIQSETKSQEESNNINTSGQRKIEKTSAAFGQSVATTDATSECIQQGGAFEKEVHFAPQDVPRVSQMPRHETSMGYQQQPQPMKHTELREAHEMSEQRPTPSSHPPPSQHAPVRSTSPSELDTRPHPMSDTGSNDVAFARSISGSLPTHGVTAHHSKAAFASSLNESHKMRMEMREQMAVQNKMRELKQKEMYKWGCDNQQRRQPWQADQQQVAPQPEHFSQESNQRHSLYDGHSHTASHERPSHPDPSFIAQAMPHTSSSAPSHPQHFFAYPVQQPYGEPPGPHGPPQQYTVSFHPVPMSTRAPNSQTREHHRQDSSFPFDQHHAYAPSHPHSHIQPHYVINFDPIPVQASKHATPAFYAPQGNQQAYQPAFSSHQSQPQTPVPAPPPPPPPPVSRGLPPLPPRHNELPGGPPNDASERRPPASSADQQASLTPNRTRALSEAVLAEDFFWTGGDPVDDTQLFQFLLDTDDSNQGNTAQTHTSNDQSSAAANGGGSVANVNETKTREEGKQAAKT